MSNMRFDFPPASQKKTTARPYHLLYVTSCCYDKDWNSLIHSHSSTEIFFCVSGCGEFYAAGSTFPIRTNDLLIIDSGIEHAEYSSASQPLEYLVLGVSGLKLQFPSVSKDVGYVRLNFGRCAEEVLFYLKTILKEADTRSPNYEEACSCILDLLMICIRRLSGSVFLTSAPYQKGVLAPDRRCVLVRQYIDEFFGEKITLDRLAQMVHVNKYHLVHLFQKEYGTTPIHYLNRKRLEESCFMLKNTNHSVTQIASLLGFSSLSYFTQCFRTELGMTPSEYRATYSREQSGSSGDPGLKSPTIIIK